MARVESVQHGPAESRAVAEQARQRRWQGQSFLRELFLGRARPELLSPGQSTESERPAFTEFYTRLSTFLREQVDPAAIDERGEYPPNVLRGLAELGAFGMKISREYGGLGFSQREYVKVMQLLGSYDGNLTALLSAHQSIGVPHPVSLFGSEALKRKYLPRCARGTLSAFALTEPSVGSDPSRLATTAHPTEDGKFFILDGQKLWCTNGTLAGVIVVLARNPLTHAVSCFVVETDWEGVVVEHRCHFMGLRALANGVLSFHGVRVPRENLVGEEGAGLRIALVTLNTGRLTPPAATAGGAKLALEICRKWCSVRSQWGAPIGHHEAVTHKLAEMAATTYAMDAVAETAAMLADRKDRDIRLEAAAAKEWNTIRGWELTDSALQLRGGRGYEKESSLSARGEAPVGIERMLRDSRVNRIFEGSSEIMHLFIAREAVDKHLEVAGVFADPHASTRDRLRALPRILWFYARWYPRLWVGLAWAHHHDFGPLARHVRYVERASKRLARSVFHGMLRYGAGLERKQAFLFRAVDVALELMALMAVVLKAKREPRASGREAEAVERFAQLASQRVESSLKGMWHNDDAARYAFGREVLDGKYAWLERGSFPLGYEASDLVPMTMQEYLARREAEHPGASLPSSAAHEERHTYP